MMKKKVAVFGEMLWDCLPSGAVPGGAPMNVALNLHKLGLESRLISAVGEDQDGQALLDFLRASALPLDLIQVLADQPTSKVLVDDSDPENMKYEIVAPVAWDYIAPSAKMLEEVSTSDALVFGSLGVRHSVSFDTLLELLPLAKLRVFDVNLRWPFVDFQKIEQLLGFADIVKINEEEYEELATYFHLKPEMHEVADFLKEEFDLKMVCVTLGAKGAFIQIDRMGLRHNGYRVKVQDTIGAGDAFLSGLIYQQLQGKDLVETLEFSGKLGAFVAGQKGGTPEYSLEQIERLRLEER
ncbi:carbohydrate kinase family protein [Algoriphagus namhaensis]